MDIRRSDSEEGFVVDVGEEELFYVEIPGALRYIVLQQAERSLVVKADLPGWPSVVVRLVWSSSKRVAQSKGYNGMVACGDLNFVPKLHSRDVHLIGSTFVGTVVRDYVQGDALNLVWPLMSHEERAAIMGDVADAVTAIAERTSGYFWRLQGQNLATGDPITALNYRILLSKLTRELGKADMGILNIDPFHLTATLCHGSLRMDHVIVMEGRLSGLVGWSACDYTSEVMDRISYYFSVSMKRQDESWCNFVAGVPIARDYPPPVYVMAIMYYFYYRLKRWCDEPAEYVDSLLETASDCILSSLSSAQGAATLETRDTGDRGSLSGHTITDHSTAPVPPTSFDTESRPQSSTAWDDWSDSGTVIDIIRLL